MFGIRTSNLLKRFTNPLIICCLVTVVLCVHTAAALDGSGTQQDPWRIQSLADFDEFAAYPIYWDFHTRLETDVNLAGRNYSTAVIAPDTDSSTGWFQGTTFTGVFDGNDHKITGLTIDDGGAGNWYLGLFGCIYQGEVRNLRLEGGSVNGTRNYVGGLVGENQGSLSNCYSTGDVSGTGWGVGGLVGVNYESVSNCYSTGDVSGDGSVGGLVGYNSSGTIMNCYSTGDVNGVESVGGLVGENPGSLSNCYSTGDVNGVGNVGGLVGSNGGSVSNCYSTGDVSGGGHVGGLVGTNGGAVAQCYSTGTVSGYYYVGGLVGSDHEEDDYGTATDSFWDMETSDCNNSAGGTPKTTAEMKTKSTFTDAGWDFVEIWGIGENQTYPFLRTEPAGDLNYDKKVDFFDLAILASHWLECIGPNQGGWRLVEDDTEDSYSCEGNFDAFYPCSNAVDEDWDTYALSADPGATSYIYENYTIPSGIEMADFEIKYQQTAPVTPGLCTSVTDYWDGSAWAELNCTALTGQISTLTVRIPNDALSRTTLQLRTRVWKSSGLIGSGSGMYYEGKVIWYFPVCQTIVVGGYK